MIDFYRQLDIGVSLSLISDIDKNKLVKKLKSLNSIRSNTNTIRLKSSLFIGKIDINSFGIGFCEVYTKKRQKDFLIEKNDLNGANKGDIVLIARSYAKSSRAKAKVITVT